MVSCVLAACEVQIMKRTPVFKAHLCYMGALGVGKEILIGSVHSITVAAELELAFFGVEQCMFG